MLSWKLMKATESACQRVCYGEEAAAHYKEPYSMLDRWAAWWSGFFEGLRTRS